MPLDNTLCYLTARGAQVPVGEEARLETISLTNADRYAIKFDAASTQQLIWTIPYWPTIYDGSGTLNLIVQFIMTSATSGNWRLSAEVEAVTPSDAVDLDSTSSFDTANVGSVPVSSTAGYLTFVSVTLTNKDSVAAGDYVRIRLSRLGADGADTATGDLRVLGATVVESLTTLDLKGASLTRVAQLGVRSSSSSFDQKHVVNETLTSDRTITWAIGDANRTLTLNASSDSFLAGANVAAKKTVLGLGTGDSPTFAGLTVTSSNAGVMRTTVVNTNSGSSAFNAVDIGNNTGGSACEFLVNSSTNTAYAGANGFTIIASGDCMYNTGGVSDRLRIKSSGDVLIGLSSGPTGTVGKTLMLGANGGNPVPPAGAAGFFAKTVTQTEAFAVDSAGNITQLSAHADLDQARDAGIVIDEDDEYPKVAWECNVFLGKQAWTYISPTTGAYQRVVADLPPEECYDWDEVQAIHAAQAEEKRAGWLAHKEINDTIKAKFDQDLEKWEKYSDLVKLMKKRPKLDLVPLEQEPPEFVKQERPKWIKRGG